MVAATYMDEFAERHTREMIVRNALGATIPSAGVGTCLTRRLIEHFVRTRGNVLMTGCVTEDYILGVEAKRAGFKAAFAAVSAQERQGLDYVATREFFPKSLAASIKQKTRWVYGINFEATRKLGWAGDAWDRYFFVRDRKGAVTNFLPAVSLVFLLLIFFGVADPSATSPELQNLLAVSVGANLVFLVLRYFVRVASVSPGVRRLGSAWDRVAMAGRALHQYGGRLARLEDLPRGFRLRHASDRVGENRPRNPRRSCERQTLKGQVMRVLIAFGTRPEIIKLGPVWQALRKRDGVTVDAFWSGQHLELAEGLLDLFDIEVTFNSGKSVMQQPGLGSKLGEMTRQIERALLNGRYDWIVVQGDTATATAAAMAGFLCRVPVAHVEAGLRTNDLQSPWPEEFNRRVITVASTLHFAPTARAAFNLRKENVPADCIRGGRQHRG